ncbi:hypothetical protein DL98DRAFT_610494 [Cadophora sp. DSE1049]|nr:hypothetical protein DL98DRAFT_610494 [Cadophora sp. DSE1049]
MTIHPPQFAGQPNSGQQYFAQHPNMMQYEDVNSKGFQPEIGLFNERAYTQNQFINSSPQRREGRASSATPPVHTNLAVATKQRTHGDSSSSLRASPKTPTTAAEKHEKELNLDQLISQYSESKPAAAASVNIQRIIVHMSAKSQAPSLGSPTNITEPINIGGNTGRDAGKQVDNNKNGKLLGSRHTSNSSVSEGEISEEKDPNPRESSTAIRAKLKEAQAGGKIPKVDEPVSRRPWDKRTDKPYTHPLRDKSPPRQPPPANPKSQVQRNREDRREEVEMRSEKRAYQPDYKNERKQYPDSKQPAYQRRDKREEDHRRPESNEQRREEVINRPVRQQKPPTLNDLLPLNKNLQEYKILNRRRVIAALDAKRDQLLAEIEAEERGGLPAVAGSQVPTSLMLPPPIPNKVGGRTESIATRSRDITSDPQRDRVVSNKRPYSDIGDPRGEVNGSGRRAFESRPPARGRGYESDNVFDREDVPERGRGGYEVRGNYRGRAYDPNYRSRGRGRGRSDSRDGRDFNQNSEVKMETGFGSKIANGKPFKDQKGFDRGGRGETRYFIVKSINGENVLRCIQDSVWTTQIQNGSIFKEAFETCKNVILAFSINKSRIFQGYLVVCSTRFHRIGHLKNALNDNLAVLIGKDGQEIEENCGAGLIELIDDEASLALGHGNRYDDRMWDDHDHY